MAAVKDIDALLPQTQCGECGYSGCLPYAEALAQGVASIDKCPPGGGKLVQSLATLLQIDAEPFLAAAKRATRPPALAVINEAECIGCTKCIQACPVDAIIGSAKLMHAIITHECTGCGLCVEPCPVDCISMMPLDETKYDKDLARNRFNQRKIRQLRAEQAKLQSYREKTKLKSTSDQAVSELNAKREYILQAVARKVKHE